MRHSRLLTLVSVSLLGCADPNSGLPGDDGKADDADRKGDVRCVVAQVLDSGVLEESLGSPFDIDDRGALNVDSDSTEVRIELAAGVARLGTSQFRRKDGGDITLTPADEDAEDPHRTYRIQSESGEVFELAVFTASGVGILSTERDEGSGKLDHFATLDCRPGAQVPNDDDSQPAASCAGTIFEGGHCRFENGQFASARCCHATCDVTLVDDDNVFEESLGALWDISVDGSPSQDEDSTSLDIDLTRDAAWRIGQSGFSAKGGDTLGRRAGLESEFQLFTIDSSSGEKLEVRIFDTSRLGVITIREDGDTEARLVSRLDCRGGKRPALFE